jgi:hypothetical protein
MQIVAASRAMQAQMEQAQAAMKSMGVKIPGLTDRLSMPPLPIEGWNACEAILKAHAAQ